jgi:hypothetical protein
LEDQNDGRGSNTIFELVKAGLEYLTAHAVMIYQPQEVSASHLGVDIVSFDIGTILHRDLNTKSRDVQTHLQQSCVQKPAG